MFAWWGRTLVRARWWVLAATGALVALGAVWGAGVFGALSGGGFDDPSSPSSVAHARINEELGRQDQEVIVLYSTPRATVNEAGLRGPVTDALARVAGRPEVHSLTSYYTTGSPALVSADRHATYVTIQLRDGDENAKLADLEALRPLLVADGVETTFGGAYGFLRDANVQIEGDIVRAEMLSLPIVLLLTILIFRGLIAAATPLLVGGVAILGAFTVTRAIAGLTEVSIFAANVITMLGLAMAIDYALFVVSRFREELAAGRDPSSAIARTIVTAGRTVAISGITVALALSSLLLFPFAFLKSMAYGGMAAVLVAMIASLTSLPALLVILGHRINAWRVPLPRLWRRARASGASAKEQGAWARIARSVMRRPALYLVGVTAVLLAIASPFLRADFGGFDERVLPEGTPSRTVTERIADEFPGGSVAPVLVLVSGATPEQAQAFAGRLAVVPDVTGATIAANRGMSWLMAVSYPGEPSSEQARDVVRAVRAVPAPDGAETFVGGRPAADLDTLDRLGERLPWMALYAGLVTILLLFFAFGSVVLPIKAVVMNAISIGASFGVVVWIFQDGHLADWLGFTPTGFLEPTNLILMLAILFGLSTDYEVFLLSRVREEWDRTGRNSDAVAAGLQRTGGIITAAALLLIIVVGGFATGGAATIKMLGIGTVVAVAVDATLVRTLLVPATMRLLGRWNWWAPGPLARVYRRYGLREDDQPAAVPELAATPR
jgi:RND superfamily putative drug exporter